jgi:rod shape-determining protein MreC
VTSGLGGGFPAGYPVGTVSEVKRDPAQSLADVEVRPAAALDRSRELMFVWLKAGRPVVPPKAAPAATRRRIQVGPPQRPRRRQRPSAPAPTGAPKK